MPAPGASLALLLGLVLLKAPVGTRRTESQGHGGVLWQEPPPVGRPARGLKPAAHAIAVLGPTAPQTKMHTQVPSASAVACVPVGTSSRTGGRDKQQECGGRDATGPGGQGGH